MINKLFYAAIVTQAGFTKTYIIMKTTAISVMLILLLSGVTSGQRPITITEDSLKFERSSMPAFSVKIPEVEYDKTVKEWTKLLQSNTKSKVVNDNGQLSIFGARIKDIYENPVNVYSTLDQVDSAVNMKVAFEMRKDEFISNPEKEKAKTFLMNFAKDQYVSLVKDQLDAEKSNLSKLERDLSALEREQKRMEKSNRDNYELISAEKGRLDALNNQLASLSAELGSRTNPTENTGMGASYDNDPKRMKEVEKQVKQTTRDIRTTEKKISKAENDVDENKRQIPENINSQNDLRMRVAKQEAVVQKFETKLQRVKDYR